MLSPCWLLFLHFVVEFIQSHVSGVWVRRLWWSGCGMKGSPPRWEPCVQIPYVDVLCISQIALKTKTMRAKCIVPAVFLFLGSCSSPIPISLHHRWFLAAVFHKISDLPLTTGFWGFDQLLHFHICEGFSGLCLLHTRNNGLSLLWFSSLN